MSTTLHKSMLAFNHHDSERDQLMRDVWAGTPWMLNVRTGSVNSEDWYKVSGWLRTRFGLPAFPFGDNPRPGFWQLGGATLYGWSWIGFSTEDYMNEFVAEFPDLVEYAGDAT